MLIFQKNFNTPQRGGSWFIPQFNVNPGEQDVQTQTAPTNQPSSRTNTPLNSSYNPALLNSSIPGLDRLTRRALYKNEQEAVQNQVQSSAASQVNSMAMEGTRNTSKPYNPKTDSPLVNVDENVPIVGTLAEEENLSTNPNPQNSSSNNSGQTNVGGNTPVANETSGQLESLAPSTREQTGQGLVDKFNDIKSNAVQKFGELSSKYGEGVSGSLAGDLGLAAGGLALAGGAYHLIKKRKEKKKAEKEALNARISK